MLVVTFAILLLLCLCKNTFIRAPSFPPGPPCVPLLGNLLSVWWGLKECKSTHLLWQKWSKIYGSVFSLKLGAVDIVIVSGKDMIKEVSSREVFDGRPDGFFYLLRSFGKKLGLVFSDGATWMSTRRTVLRYLKSFGYGTRSMEAYIVEECDALLQLRAADAGTPVHVNHMFDVPIVNIVWRLVTGKRHDVNDPRLKTLCELTTRAFRVANMSGGVLNFAPRLRHLFPRATGYAELVHIHALLYRYIDEIIEEHKRTIDLKNPRDVIDALLIDMIEKKTDAFSSEHLQVVCLDLLEAGLETVSNTLTFIMLHLALNPQVQKKIHKEIDQFVSRERRPTLVDRGRMIYTEAAILEGLRISTVPAVGIPHMTLDDAKLNNYVIPKDTFVFLAMYDLHNGEHWKDPKVFRPERFLTKEGNLMQDEWFMPFGTGRRRCMGEGVARCELFLFVTHLLQRFQLAPAAAPPEPTPSTEPVDGVSLSLPPYKLIFTHRK